MTWLSTSTLLHQGRPSDHVVAMRDGKPIGFARFRADVAAAATHLAGCGRAALACEDAYWFAVGLLALLQAEAEVVLPPNSQSGTLGDLGLLVVDDAAIANAPVAAFAFRAVERGKIVFHTSGSSGTPKQVEKSLDMLQRESEALQAIFGSPAVTGPVLGTVSHQHLYGLAFRLLWPMSAGLPFDAAIDAVWETVLPKLHAGSVLISSPAHLGRLAGLDPVAPSRCPSLIFSAGALLPPEAAMASQTILGRLPTEIFGSTETGAMATRRQISGDDPWTLLPGTEIRVDGEGRMAVRSAYTAGWQQTEDVIEPVETTSTAALRTPLPGPSKRSPACAPIGGADTIRLAIGGFRFLGRADRIVKIEGARVSLPAVEAALEALPWVSAAAVTALPSLPVRLGGLLVLTADGQERQRVLGPFQFGRLLRRSLLPVLESAGLPRHWRFAAALPVRHMGKRDDGAVAAFFADAK